MPVGRNVERERVNRLLAGARSGRSGVLVIRGEAGIGKTTLLDQAAADGRDLRTVRGAGVESEAELPFSGLHLLLLPFVDRLDALPDRQAAALRSAFGLADAPAPDRFLVGAATLTLLSELAADRPLLCLVDDAQWLDLASSDALLFAARRLRADPIALLFAIRDEARPFPAPGLDVLKLGGLDRASAAGLLDDRVPGLTAPARARLLAESGGNPLALIELATALRAEEGRAESPHRTGPLRVTGQVLETFRARVAELPAATRLLVVIAADGTADPDVVLGAAGTLGLSAVDLGPAEDARQPRPRTRHRPDRQRHRRGDAPPVGLRAGPARGAGRHPAHRRHPRVHAGRHGDGALPAADDRRDAARPARHARRRRAGRGLRRLRPRPHPDLHPGQHLLRRPGRLAGHRAPRSAARAIAWWPASFGCRPSWKV
ncbi:AAA family ATPase [Actinomadura xylanilytica]|uniref:AAA family ATPase n=1 Tax=Actinomadura xylanilytica TaxID=887459 RepID=UPI003D80CD01